MKHLKHCETSRNTQTLAIQCNNVGSRWGDIGAWRSGIVLGVAISALVPSFRQHQHGVSGDIGDCGVGITQWMCNRITNHGDMGTFSKPGIGYICMLIKNGQICMNQNFSSGRTHGTIKWVDNLTIGQLTLTGLTHKQIQISKKSAIFWTFWR